MSFPSDRIKADAERSRTHAAAATPLTPSVAAAPTEPVAIGRTRSPQTLRTVDLSPADGVQPGSPVTASNSAGGARDARLTGPQSEWGLRCAMVATISYTDGPLPLAKRRLGDAVHALADPRPVAINGAYLWTDSVYIGLRGALRGSKTGSSGLVRSAPCRIENLDALRRDRHHSGRLGTRKGHNRSPAPADRTRL
jgi:hypothetical protein